MPLMFPPAAPVTFTPVFSTFSTPPTGVTYSTQIGRAVKQGRLVTVFINLVLTSKGTGGTGSISITGLPFASDATTGLSSILVARIGNLTLDSGYTDFVGVVLENGTVIAINQQGSAVAGTSVNYGNAVDTTVFRLTGSYLAAA